MRLARWAAGLSTLTLGAMTAAGLAEAVADPIQRTANLALPGLARDARPYRIALLSDIHIGNRAMQPARLQKIVAAVNAARPDLIVITGDFVNGDSGKLASDPRELITPLRQLVAPDGVIATMGNHDHWTDLASVEAALRQAGVTLLSNQAIRAGPLVVLGLDDRYTDHADVPTTAARARAMGGIPIAINHSPDLAEELPDNVALLLAGHTHCGQVVLPIIGSLAPIFGKLVGDRHYYLPQYQCGIVRDGKRSTVVTAGLGSGSIPLRIGAPPDWWLVTLSAPQP